MGIFKLFVLSTLALMQVHHAYSFSFFGGNSAPAQTEPDVVQDGMAPAPVAHQQHHQHGYHQGFHGGMGGVGQMFRQTKLQLSQLMKPFGGGGFGNGHMQQWAPQISIHQIVGRQQFYDKCGVTSRKCEWTPSTKQVNSKLARTHHHVEHQGEESKLAMEFVCVTDSHICVGNTETCVANHSCDVALKMLETKMETNGKTVFNGVVSVSHLNNCNMDAQSVTDGSKMPQMLYAVGFATYDEAGTSLECRHPKASDFKLVFLWKNTTEEEAQGHKQICTEKPKEEEFFAVKHESPLMMQSIHFWHKICKKMEKKEESFNLKTFLESHVPVAEYTSFFSPPFSFAENYEPKYSSNGMVISGTV